jgi:glycosyltransferase involved in cell wall biosynthesis
MRARLRVNIIYGDNGSGLSRDATVVRQALRAAGHAVRLTPLAPRPFPVALHYAPELARQAYRGATQSVSKHWARRTRPWDVNIFFERLLPECFDTARVNCFFPNQEWLTEDDRKHLREVDLVLFKTQLAMDILAGEAKAAFLVGFTSLDRLDTTTPRNWRSALHVGGWNPHKGTAAVLTAWQSNAEWPELTVVSQLASAGTHAPNIRHIGTRVSDGRLRHMQNLCGVHVCPSEVEGFGHTLVEAMSCGAIVVATDAPPMNELITPREGFLVPYSSTTTMGAGTRYFVDQPRLNETLARVWRLGSGARGQLSTAARTKFDQMRLSFHQALTKTLNGL